MRKRPLRIGVLGMEFFDQSLGRMGGFGWAARQLVEVLDGFGDPPVEIVLLAGSRPHPDGVLDGVSHGAPILFGSGSRRHDLVRLWRHRLDLLIAIDWSPRYVSTVRALPRTPLVIWSRDPRPRSVHDTLQTLRLPGAPTPPDPETYRPDHSVATIARSARRTGRPLAVATTAPFLIPLTAERFGADAPGAHLLTNPVTITRASPRSELPTVAFLGRLDPVKRPWLVLELARRFPDVRFELAGGRYVDGWEPIDVPANVILLGHLGEATKADLLSRAWVLINTSIHEGLPVSVCEALRVGTPLLSTVSAGGVAARFGVFTGAAGGDGRELLDPLEAGLRSLLGNDGRRDQLGAAGRAWGLENHSVAAFVDRLVALLDHADSPEIGRLIRGSIDARPTSEADGEATPADRITP